MYKIKISDKNKAFYKMLDSNKIKLNCNKKPIKMSIFLDFLTVPVNINSSKCFRGWTLRENPDLNLYIGGGIVNGIEYVDYLIYGDRLQSNYSNHVNPFYLCDILTDKGIAFFFDYYKEEILNVIGDQESKVASIKKKVEKEMETLRRYQEELDTLNKVCLRVSFLSKLFIF